MSDAKLQVACSHCMVPNKLPANRLAEGPNCGRCKQPLLVANAIAPAQADFDRLLRNTELPIVVDFWADWCGPCKMMAPVFERMAAEYLGRFHFVKVDTEREQALAMRYQIRSIPTLMIVKGGVEVARQAGAMDPTSFKRWLDSF